MYKLRQKSQRRQKKSPEEKNHNTVGRVIDHPQKIEPISPRRRSSLEGARGVTLRRLARKRECLGPLQHVHHGRRLIVHVPRKKTAPRFGATSRGGHPASRGPLPGMRAQPGEDVCPARCLVPLPAGHSLLHLPQLRFEPWN